MKIVRGVLSFLYTLAIYLGLPLLGWGINGLPGFFSHPQLAGYAISIAAFGVLAGYLIQRPGGMGNTIGKGNEKKFVPRQRIVRICVTAMLFFGLVFMPFADRRGIAVMPGGAAARWAGLVLETLGMALIFWSSIELGRLYSPEVTLQKDHCLVTSGPYRLIRHPRYLGGMILSLGLSLLFRSWIGLALTVVFIAVILFRINDEEQLMAKEFGAEWRAYSKKTWRLIPAIY